MNSSYDEQHSNWPWHAHHHHQPWLLPPGPGPSLQWSSTTATVHNLLFVSARGWGRRENVSNLPLIPNWCVFCFILKYYHVLSIHTCCQLLTCSWSCHQPPPRIQPAVYISAGTSSVSDFFPTSCLDLFVCFRLVTCVLFLKLEPLKEFLLYDLCLTTRFSLTQIRIKRHYESEELSHCYRQ